MTTTYKVIESGEVLEVSEIRTNVKTIEKQSIIDEIARLQLLLDEFTK